MSCFLCFTSSVSFTGSYTEVKPNFGAFTSHGEFQAGVSMKFQPGLEFSRGLKLSSCICNCIRLFKKICSGSRAETDPRYFAYARSCSILVSFTS